MNFLFNILHFLHFKSLFLLKHIQQMRRKKLYKYDILLVKVTLMKIALQAFVR